MFPEMQYRHRDDKKYKTCNQVCPGRAFEAKLRQAKQAEDE